MALRFLFLRLRQLMLGSLALSLLGAMLVLQQWSFTSRHILTHPYFNYSVEPADPDQTCQLPRIHPFDQSIWKYFPPPKPIVCKSRQPDGLLRFDGTGWIQLDPDLAGQFSRLSCSYRTVIRPEGNDLEIRYGPEIPVPATGVRVREDFILARCSNRNLLGIVAPVYEAFLVQAATAESFTPRNSSSNAMNVLMFGVDSLSRLSFIRLLPLTYAYLTEVLGAHVFKGMNKVADNTFPNLNAILSGDELYSGRLPFPPEVAHYDDWPLLWHNYSARGYSTLFAEDLPDYNMFNYMSTGFLNPPTPHYMRPFWLAVQGSRALQDSSHLCLGAKSRHLYQVEYVLDFVLRHGPSFAFSFLAEVSHDYLSRAASADQDFRDFLRTLKESGALDRTLLIFFSDHGHRFDAIRSTPVGRVEERMPFFSVVLPKEFPARDMTSNLRRLVTPYDVHATLLDFLELQNRPDRLGRLKTRFGQSLFGPVPANRTCGECGVPKFFCVCSMFREDGGSEPLEPAGDQLIAGRAVIDAVNAILPEQCVRLSLSEVRSSSALHGGWVVVVEAEPSGALLEAVVERSTGYDFEVQGEVSRINKYKGQSECLDDARLRKYCYCRDRLPL